MKSFFVDHDFRLGDALVVTKLARQFEGCFIGLKSGRAEEHIGESGEFNQLRCQRFLQGNMVIVRGVDQLADLLLQGWHQLGVVVPECVDGNAA